VSTTSPTDARPTDASGNTLGSLLYADAGQPRVSEADWVALVQAIGEGDQVALHALYDRMHRIVFTLIMRIVRNRECAEELVLDVFHDVWRRAGTYDAGSGTVVGWVMNQARSRALDRLRFGHRKKRVDPHGGRDAGTVADDDSARAVHEAQQATVLRDALATLRPEERIVIETAFFCDLTYAEVALRLNQPLGTVKTRIRSGLTKLRQGFDDAKGPDDLRR
jgi:RNA polymerase sigma-70 factor (ECF subfamily)